MIVQLHTKPLVTVRETCRLLFEYKASAIQDGGRRTGGIENALNQIASTTDRSGNMKKELKQTIYQTVSKLRKLFATLIDVQNSKTRTIAELEKMVASNKLGIEVAKRSTQSPLHAI